MGLATAQKRKLNTVSLTDAVLCVQCETISDSPHDRCLVCGSSSLFNLHRALNGVLPRSSNLSGVKYNLEIKVKVSGMTASDLNSTAESITHLLASQQNGQWESLHIDVDSVLEEVHTLAA